MIHGHFFDSIDECRDMPRRCQWQDRTSSSVVLCLGKSHVKNATLKEAFSRSSNQKHVTQKSDVSEAVRDLVSCCLVTSPGIDVADALMRQRHINDLAWTLLELTENAVSHLEAVP